MNKKELLSIRALNATPKMIRLAAADSVQKRTLTRWGQQYTRTGCQYDLFMRCVVQDDILKVALFLPRLLRLGARTPAYDVYIDREARQFLTYSHEKETWLTGKLDRLDWGRDWWDHAERWLSPADAKLVGAYFGKETGNYWDILKFQQAIRDEELVRRHRKETDPWDADLAQTPALPKDWNRWVAKVGVPDNYIFYQYKRGGAKTGWCSYCERDVPIKGPHHNDGGRCPRCRKTITFKSIGKAGTVQTRRWDAYLMQRCADGFVIRQFRAELFYRTGKYMEPETICREIRRVIFSSQGRPLRAYYWGLYKQRNMRWIAASLCSPRWWGSDSGRVYGRTLPDLSRRGLGRTGLLEYIQRKRIVDPEKYLAVLAEVPQLEQLSKAGLPRLTDQCLQNYENIRKRLTGNATSLTKMLGIDAQELKRLRENNGGIDYLTWFQYEKASGREVPDETISWFCGKKVTPDDLKFIRNRMSAVQIRHYMERQLKDPHYRDVQHMLTTWADYLSMAARFHLDISNEIVYRAKNLRQRHDELVGRSSQDKDISVQIGAVMLAHPRIEGILQSLGSKYAYAGKEYLVDVPTCVEDIIQEGNYLHHCIASSDRYWDRIEQGESYLLFLRKADAPDTPYYTMEVEPGGTVRQLRTFYDNQNDDVDAARDFLREWQAVVAKRLTEKDRQAAAVSRVLREQEFEQLRRDNVIIYTGNLAGKRMVDVLTADVMENAA